MSERLERLLREIGAEKAAAMAELGLAFDGPLLVAGSDTAEAAIERRLQRVPVPLRQDAAERIRRQVLLLPWLHARRVQGDAAA
jgi:hypothetical protein